MLLETLRKLEARCLKNEHYQYKTLNTEEIEKLAAKSFARLPEDQQQKVLASWIAFAGKESNITEAIRLRFLAQTNLFFLCHLLEKYSQTTERTHEDICNQFFVSKDPANYKRFEAFALDYKGPKERMLLVPRGGFKSSIDMADTIQYVICFPEITILILTGVLDLAKDFVKEVKSHFTYDQVGTTDKGKPIYGPKRIQDTEGVWGLSAFQHLFPEHCVEPEDGPATEFQTPACPKGEKEVTVSAAGIEQVLSGWHFGVMKFDDVVTNENSNTVGRLESVNKQISVNKAMLHPFGFFDVIGTWYDEGDYYGISMAHEEMLAKEGEEPSMLVYLRSAWLPTEEAKKAGKIEAEMKEDDWILWFPERLPYKFLAKEKKKDPEGFAIKYENDPRKVHRVKFPRELLLRRTIPAVNLPQQGFIITTVDTAYSLKSFADYTVILTAIIFAGKFYIIDMVRGRFNEYELPAVIAAAGNKWKPKRIAIEDSVGVRWFSRELQREMTKLQISIPVEYVTLGGKNHAKSKELKAKPVLRLLGDERLFFSKSCAGLEELYTELEKFTGRNDTHDDIISALSILVDLFGAYADMDAKVTMASTQYVGDQQSKERHDLVYGIGRYSHLNANNIANEDNPKTVFELDNSPQILDGDINPLNDLFG